jgi:hypothetical protein
MLAAMRNSPLPPAMTTPGGLALRALARPAR